MKRFIALLLAALMLLMLLPACTDSIERPSPAPTIAPARTPAPTIGNIHGVRADLPKACTVMSRSLSS